MKRILVFTTCMGLAGLATGHFASANPAETKMPMMHEKMTMKHSGMDMKRGGKPARTGRCTPMMRDYYWLDYSRGMGMGRRMRVLHFQRNGFPPKPSANMRWGGGMRMGSPMPEKKPAGQSPVAAGGRDASSRSMAGGRRMAMRPNAHGRDDAPANAAFWLETPDKDIHRIDAKTPGKISFPAPQWGLHKVFAYLDGGVKADVRRKFFAFYSFYSHGDEAAKKQPPALNGNGYWDGSPEFELTRIYADGRQRYSTQTGQQAKFKISLHGKPLKGVCVVMMTQKGWRNARTTDENGEVSFFIIKEAETAGGRESRRRAAKYLVVARHREAYAGEIDGQRYADTRYLATMSLRVRPSQLEWESKSMAFLMAGFTVVAAGAAIAIRRRRKRAANNTKGA